MKVEIIDNIINEASLSRLNSHINNHEVGFITAFKSPEWIKMQYEIERGKNSLREVQRINRERNKDLFNNLRAYGFNVIKVDGSYENQDRKNKYQNDTGKNEFDSNDRKHFTDKEESFAVINLNDNPNFADIILNFGKKYNQESVLIIGKGGEDNKFHYTDGTIEDAGKTSFGKDAPFKSLIGGRPFVLESISEIYGPNMRTMKQLHKFSEWFIKD